MLLRQLAEGRAEVENEYTRSVNEYGNAAALRLMDEVFEPCDTMWRGIGVIPGSGLAIREKYAHFDAAKVLSVQFPEAHVNPLCACGSVLRGAASPVDCPVVWPSLLAGASDWAMHGIGGRRVRGVLQIPRG